MFGVSLWSTNDDLNTDASAVLPGSYLGLRVNPVSGKRETVYDLLLFAGDGERPVLNHWGSNPLDRRLGHLVSNRLGVVLLYTSLVVPSYKERPLKFHSYFTLITI